MKKLFLLTLVMFTMTSCNIAQVRNIPVCSVPHADSAYKRNLPAGAEIIDLNTHKVYILTLPVLGTSTLSATQGKTEISNNGLVPVTENGKTGYRFANADTANCPDIGKGAVDLSKQYYNNGTMGDYSVAMNVHTNSYGNYSLATGTQTTASGESSCTFGNYSTASGSHASAFNYSTLASGTDATAFGSLTKATGVSSFTMGKYNIASGNYSFCGGAGYSSGGENGIRNRASGTGSFNFSHGSPSSSNYYDAAADYSAILGGTGNSITTGADNAVVLGGISQTATHSNMVYVPTLKLQSQTSPPANPEGGTVYYGNNRFLGYNGTEWIHLDETGDGSSSGAASTGLEKVTVNSKTGWRLIGESPTIKENFTHLNNLEVNGRIDILNTSNNVFIGDKSGISNTASSNLAIGNSCFENNIDGQQNTAVGYYSLKYNTHGGQNTAVGVFSLVSAMGSGNTGVGTRSLNNIGTGNNNTGIGNSALVNAMNSSADNTAVGAGAGRNYNMDGYNLTNISKSVFLGSSTKAKNNNDVNEIVIGNSAVGNGSNTATIGDASITEFYAGETGAATVYKGASVYKPLSTLERDGIASVSEGMIIWNTTTKKLQQYNGTNWEDVGGGGSSNWTKTGNYLYPNTLTDSVGIGTNMPTVPFEVHGETKIDADKVAFNNAGTDYAYFSPELAIIGDEDEWGYYAEPGELYITSDGSIDIGDVANDGTAIYISAEDGTIEPNKADIIGNTKTGLVTYQITDSKVEFGRHDGSKTGCWGLTSTQNDIALQYTNTIKYGDLGGESKGVVSFLSNNGRYSNLTNASMSIGYTLADTTRTPLEKLEVNGAVKLGSTSTDHTGTIQWDGTHFKGYNGSSWLNLDESGGTGGTSNWTESGNHLFPTNLTDSVGIGTNFPKVPFEVHGTTNIYGETKISTNTKVTFSNTSGSRYAQFTPVSAFVGDNDSWGMTADKTGGTMALFSSGYVDIGDLNGDNNETAIFLNSVDGNITFNNADIIGNTKTGSVDYQITDNIIEFGHHNGVKTGWWGLQSTQNDIALQYTNTIKYGDLEGTNQGVVSYLSNNGKYSNLTNASMSIGYTLADTTRTPLEKLEVNGAVKLGSTVTNHTGTIQWDGAHFKGYNGTEWVNLDSVSSTTIPDAVYAEKFLDSIVQAVVANKNYTVIWAQTGELSGMATNDSSVTAQSDGRYLINISGSFSMDNPSATVEGWLYKNGVKDTQTGFILDAGANSDANGHYFRACVAANGVVDLRSGDVLTFKVKSSVSGVYRLYVANCSITKL